MIEVGPYFWDIILFAVSALFGYFGGWATERRIWEHKATNGGAIRIGDCFYYVVSEREYNTTYQQAYRRERNDALLQDFSEGGQPVDIRKPTSPSSWRGP